MDSLYKKIKEHQSTFSKSFKKIAAQIYSDPSIFAMNSAKEAGEKIGVSETTIIRFARKLGYDGYKSLQQVCRQGIFQKSSLSDFRDKKVSNHSKDNTVKNLMFNDIRTIQTVIEQISEMELDQTVTKLLTAENIYIAGVHSSYALASWFTYALNIVIGNVRQHTPDDDILVQLSELHKNSVFVAFSFHRYGINTIRLAELAKKQGASIIAFTDHPYSPITEYSDITLAIQLEELSTLDLVPAVFSLMNSIIAAITLRAPKLFQERVNRFDGIEANSFFAK
ncbi:MurR/RpiR family transcriptional regulator [Virgibacillus litoralis]|uniref:DNA-binding MurR/RpiR family transcriptional regulator n=1 Tax=Virgibacillus litoralis TaxID=578221 RepID=A0ABS4HFN0_9BACI|nr:MurR/RpiR family transcriptional regulator [Virgibacillus litoralis]MBP1949736.1 DNA-binding MurR/RpiR family transcriptional regulator [Virgibacillus litoralis]